MVSSSAIINKALRKHLSPIIRDAGFQKVDARNAWAWRNDCVWVMNVRAVGRYFSEVTGWPPASVAVSLGTFYTFIPSTSVKIDNNLLLPTEYQCHMRSHLNRRLFQEDRQRALRNQAEKRRLDLWWIDPDGSNADEVCADIASLFQDFTIPWFVKCSDFDAALAEVEAEHDCFSKFVLAAYLSRKLDRIEKQEKYVDLAEKEGKRIGIFPDPEKWFVVSGRI